MIQIDSADLRTLTNGTARAHRIQRGGYVNAIVPSIENLALDGQSNRFDVPFVYGNDIILLKPGCFGDLTDKRVGFRLDHIDSAELASTDDGALTLMVDDDRIQFRVHLEKCKYGSVVARMCEIDSRSAVSIGCDILDEHRETIAGHSVRVVTRARLREISLVKGGAAAEHAFAYVVNKTVTPQPVAGTCSAAHTAGQMVHKLSRKVLALKASIAAKYGAQEPTPQRKRMTMDSYVRFQSESQETERQQALARSRLRF